MVSGQKLVRGSVSYLHWHNFYCFSLLFPNPLELELEPKVWQKDSLGIKEILRTVL